MTKHLNSLTQKDNVSAEELAPSRYALRIGEIDVMVVSDGGLPLPTETMSTNADPAARAA
jgi:D-ribose pyranose/furanose isomerase RbsD